MGTVLTYKALLGHPRYKAVWAKSAANEFGRLAQGIGDRETGTNTIYFIAKEDIPFDRLGDVTYGSFVCTHRPTKADPHRTRLTVGGDRIRYGGEVGTPTADITLVKILFNSVLSTPCLLYTSPSPRDRG